MTSEPSIPANPGAASGQPSEATCASFRGKKVLVTGGLGFIGSNLARRLVELGADVLILDSLCKNSGGNRANIKGIEDRLAVRVIDLRDSHELADAFEGRNIIFNLAGQVSHIDSMKDPVKDLAANVHAQIVFLESCRTLAPQSRIVFASTRQIYGKPRCNPVDESHPLHPVDVNGVHKVAAEAYHTLYHEVYGLETVCLRLTNTFGPRMRVKDARQTFLGVWLRRVVEDADFEVWGGQQKRDLAYIDDVVEAFLLTAVSPATPGKVFNIGGCPPVTLIELAEMLVTIGGSGRFEIKDFPPERLRIDIGDYFANDRLFRQLTGWAPKIALQEGLTRTLAFYREHLNGYV